MSKLRSRCDGEAGDTVKHEVAVRQPRRRIGQLVSAIPKAQPVQFRPVVREKLLESLSEESIRDLELVCGQAKSLPMELRMRRRADDQLDDLSKLKDSIEDLVAQIDSLDNETQVGLHQAIGRGAVAFGVELDERLRQLAAAANEVMTTKSQQKRLGAPEKAGFARRMVGTMLAHRAARRRGSPPVQRRRVALPVHLRAVLRSRQHRFKRGLRHQGAA